MGRPGYWQGRTSSRIPERSAFNGRQIEPAETLRIGRGDRIANGKITEIEVIGNPARLGELAVSAVE